jgi:O-antigen/teichoic acid export membrane protein
LPPRHRSSFRRALGNVGWLLTSKGVGAVLSLAYLALATRSLGVKGFGEFALILGAAQGVAALVGFETWQIVVRFGLGHVNEASPERLRILVRFCLLLDGAAALLGCAAAAIVLSIMRVHFGWSAALARDAFLFAVVMLLAVRSTAVGIIRLYDRFAMGAIADSVTPIARCGGALVAAWQHPTITGFLIAWALSEVLTTAAYWVSARRLLPDMIGRPAPLSQVQRDNSGILRFAWQANLATTLNASSRQFAVVVVGFIAGPAAAGGYRLACQISLALLRGSDLFARAIFPEIARAHASGDGASLSMLARHSARFTVIAGLITCVAAPLLGTSVLHLIGGKAYLGAYPLLILLGVAAGLDIMAVGFEPLLVGTGRVARALHVRLLSVTILLGGMLAFIPVAGPIGAGWAHIASSGLALLLFASSARIAAAKP